MKWENKGHELDFIGDNFRKRKEIYIYGTGNTAKSAYNKTKFLNCFGGFIDANKKKQKEGYLGYKVYSMSEILEKNSEEFCIIIAEDERAIETKVARMLLFNGYREGIDFFFYYIFVSFYLQIYAMYAHDKLVINIYPQSMTEKCTLNCKYCNHSLPYLKDPMHFKKEEFIEDLDLAFKYIDYVYSADFVGGELFLHPDLYEMMKYAAENYRHKMDRMQFVTNATILPSQEVLDLMKEYDITMVVSDYTETLPQLKKRFDEVISLTEENGVKVVVSPLGTWKDYGIGTAELGFNEEKEKIEHFDHCANPCRYMREGKLYYCTSDRLAQRAGLTPEDELSYIDLRNFPRERRMEILEFELGFNERGYLLLCNKCNGNFEVNDIEVPKAEQYVKEEE